MNPRLKSFLMHFIVLLAAIVAAGWVLKEHRLAVSQYNWPLLYQGLVTFTTGALIALFIAIFYSTQRQMQFLRQHPQSRTLYAILVTDLVGIVLTGGLLDTTAPHKLALGLVAAVVMVMLTVDLIIAIMRLVGLGVGQR